MTKRDVKNYLFVGLDFIFDKNDTPWFIEANFAPHGLAKYMKKIDDKIITKLINLLKKNGKNICYIMGKYRKESSDNCRWFYNFLKRRLDISLCYIEDNLHRKKSLIAENGEKIIPDTVFSYDTIIIPDSIFNSFGDKFVNKPNVKKIVRNKLLLYNLIKSKVRVPKTFLVKSEHDVKNIIKRHGLENGFVIKPLTGSLGRNVHVFSSNRYIPKIKKKMIMQERIVTKKIKDKFWDVRVYVIDGKYAGSVVRLSDKKVTNFSKGAKPEKLPKRLESKLIKLSQKVVMSIDKESEKIK